MEQRTRALVASAFIGLIFLLVQLGALALVQPFEAAGYQAVEDPSDPTNTVVYVAAILIATGLMLLAIKLDVDQLIRAFVVFAGVYLSWYVFSVVVPSVVTYAGFNVLAVAAALALGAALLLYPEWYVIDATGVVMGAGAAGLFGISFGLLPAILLLAVLAIYDAISVYGTEHMLTLASGVMDLKVPVVLVVPLTLSYSFLSAETPDPTGEVEGEAAANGGAPESEEETVSNEADDGEDDEAAEAEPMDRDALFIGLGDAVIPTVLVASAAFFAPASVPTVGALGLVVPVTALGAMVGTFLGLALLLRMVLAGRAHAGLPLLNGGVIGGYLVGALVSGIPLLEALGLAGFL
ncbi:presenilin family intramembrane aspartyl protease PSH [Halorientalis regularis]|uniref:Presenilin-like membrane protease, A22 family n=1 Tax=Halorientalis regularis TaxID=660518 RepID=A0A1G7FL63_9EURY|nr:presenilin family intramembrane aspartyl protease PSH [Halorientalis regularis]SDE76681.1 Presenilin-like membrane protease, A22 family [Halorientalis regularis]